jgi:hypothetical protein
VAINYHLKEYNDPSNATNTVIGTKAAEFDNFTGFASS